jgi:hypothetical protein
MKRETRLNLIFLAAFLAISLPGAVILFRKKLDPNASRMTMPDAVRRRLPYVTPFATASDVRRYVPPMTGEWVERLAGGPMLTRDGLPLMSEDYLLQAVTATPNGSETDVGLILWDSRASAEAADLAISVDNRPGRIIRVESVLLPAEVRQELLSGGYPQPPHHIIWIKAALPIVSERQAVQINYRIGQTAAATSVNLFTR